MPTHTLYVDDSGQKEYPKPDQEFGFHISRHFVLGGVLISTVEAGNLVKQIRSLKERTFGIETVEVKSNWLRMPSERRQRYLELYGLDDPMLDRFVDSFYTLVSESDLLLIGSVVDKQHMIELYGEEANYPPALAYEFLLQRAQNELAGKGTFGVIVDVTSGKTPKGREYRRLMEAQHNSLKQHGSRFIQGFSFTALEGKPNFVDSGLSHMVQVADLVAYNVFRQFREYGEEWDREGLRNLPTYDWFHRLTPKFRKGPGGRIQGYGVVKMPKRSGPRWSRSS